MSERPAPKRPPRSGLSRSSGSRSLDVLGMPGLIALLSGAAIVAIVVFVIDPLDFPSRADARQASMDGFADGYVVRQEEGFELGFEESYLHGFAVGTVSGSTTPYGVAFSDAFQRGWDDAIAAARAAAESIPLPADATEFVVLDEQTTGASAAAELRENTDP